MTQTDYLDVLLAGLAQVPPAFLAAAAENPALWIIPAAPILALVFAAVGPRRRRR